MGTSLVSTTEEGIKSSEESWIDQNSTARTKDQVSTMLSTKIEDNITAGSAKQQMMMYKDQIVDLQYELEDLPKEAKRIFK
jgi:archaellum component FlaC